MSTIDYDYNMGRGKYVADYNNMVIAVEKVRRVGLKIPSSIEDKLHLAESQREESEKMFDDARKKFSIEGESEASGKMREAIYSINATLREVYELYFGYLYPKVCEARNSYSDYEYIAAKHFPKSKYSKHKEHFRIIEEHIKNDEKLLWRDVGSECDWLKEFLNDFDSVKEELLAEVEEKREAERDREEAKERFQTSIKATNKNIKVGIAGVIVAVLGVIAVVAFGIKGCIDSSQQPTQPEATASAAGP